jgi:hypothetical protein
VLPDEIVASSVGRAAMFSMPKLLMVGFKSSGYRPSTIMRWKLREQSG